MGARPHPPSAIATDLRELGLASGDLVMVHASLRAVGPIDGGAHGLIDAIRAVVGARGTMMMVLGALDEHAWVNERPEEEREDLLRGAEPFDARVTPADPEVGILAEVFRGRPETLVSDHPEGRFAAAGALAEELLADVPWHDYFGPGSPLETLVLERGRVLRLGAAPNTVTALHLAEYRCTVRPRRRVRRHRLVATAHGPQIRSVECLDDDDGIVDYDGEDYFADILHGYLATGRARTGLVGRAPSELIDARDIVAFGVRWMDEHLVAPAVALQARLDADLVLARRRGDQHEIAAIRSLKTALANAEAVPVAEAPYDLLRGSADVPRQYLDREEVEAVVATEAAERERAIGEYRSVGADSGALGIELATIERYRGAT